MAVKGASQVVRNYKRLAGKTTGPTSEAVLNQVLSIGAAQAKIYTPVDTSDLINSQRIEVRPTANGYKGYVFYTQEYAFWLENKESWQPRKKKTAKPHFLQSGFEDAGPRTRIRNAIINGYKIDKVD